MLIKGADESKRGAKPAGHLRSFAPSPRSVAKYCECLEALGQVPGRVADLRGYHTGVRWYLNPEDLMIPASVTPHRLKYS